MTIADPFSNPQAWDTLVIAGAPTPGVLELEECDRPFGWDVKKGKGADGATLTHTGRELAKIKGKIRIWSADQFAQWDAMLPTLKYEPTKGQPVVAVDVYHPAIASIDVTAVVVKTLGAPKHVGHGLYEIAFEFIEYRPPPPVNATASPTTAVGGAGLPDAPPVDPQIVALQAQVAATMAQAQAAFAP